MKKKHLHSSTENLRNDSLHQNEIDIIVLTITENTSEEDPSSKTDSQFFFDFPNTILHPHQMHEKGTALFLHGSQRSR